MNENNNQEPTGEPEGNEDRLKMFSSYAIRGAEALRRHLEPVISEEEYLRFAGAIHADARAYVIYGALDEVEKTAAHLIRLKEVLSGKEVSPRDCRISRNVITSLIEAIRAQGRRLVELLVTLVLFKTTNDQDHFRHLLLLEELVDRLRRNQDFEDFHGARSIGLDKRIDDLVQQLVGMQSAIPALVQAWYAGRGVAGLTGGVRPNANNLLSSARARIQQALPHMTASEKITFGFTYGEGYGEPSEMIHYSVRGEGWKIQPGEAMREATRLGMLAWDVLLRCHELLGAPDLPVVRWLARTYQANPYPGELVQRQMVGDLEAGDFVLVHGVTYLAEILEVKVSQFGYRSFRVRFLVERPMHDVEEDWVPARSVRKLYNKEEMVRRVSMPSERLSEEDRTVMAEIFAGATGEQLQEALRETLKDMWEAGLREWYHRGLFFHQDKQERESLILPPEEES